MDQLKIFISLLMVLASQGFASNVNQAPADDLSRTIKQHQLEVYRDFLRYIRERQERQKPNKAAIAELKARQQAEAAEREVARKAYIQQREEQKARFDAKAKEEYLEKEKEAQKQAQKKEYEIFAAHRKRIQHALKGVPQINPHDEFEVGSMYEEDEEGDGDGPSDGGGSGDSGDGGSGNSNGD